MACDTGGPQWTVPPGIHALVQPPPTLSLGWAMGHTLANESSKHDGNRGLTSAGTLGLGPLDTPSWNLATVP